MDEYKYGSCFNVYGVRFREKVVRVPCTLIKSLLNNRSTVLRKRLDYISIFSFKHEHN